MAPTRTLLNRLVPSSRSDSTCVPVSRTSRPSEALSCVWAGPMMVLRPALPKVPGAGMTNASVLKKRRSVGESSATGTPR